jgi:hypothetical protein
MEKIIYTAEVIDKLDGLIKIFMAVGWLWLVIDFGVSADCGFLSDDEDDKYQHREFIKTVRRLFIVFLVSISLTIINVFVPSKKTYLRMHAAEIIEEVQKNNYWKKSLSEKEIQIVNEWIKENEQK